MPRSQEVVFRRSSALKSSTCYTGYGIKPSGQNITRTQREERKGVPSLPQDISEMLQITQYLQESIIDSGVEMPMLLKAFITYIKVI